MKKEQDNKKKVDRWNDWPSVTVTKSSKEEIKELKEKAFNQLENFVKNGIKRKN